MPLAARSLVVASYLLTSAVAAAQPNATSPKPAAPILPGDSSIAGRVIEQATDEGVAGAIVTLESVDRARALVAPTDLDGRYSFTRIAAGDYRVSASHPGYVKTEFGLRAGRSSNTPRTGVITLERDVARTNLDLYLARSLTVTGRVTRHDGGPIAGARVIALPPLPEQSSDDPSMPPGAFGRTNAKGEYVLSNLPEGLYQISAVTEGDSRTRGNSLVHYPGTTRAEDAVAVKVSRTAAANNIDIVFPASELLRISGTIIHSDGATGTEAFLQAGRETYPVTVSANGTFTTSDLRAGRYTLVARARKDDEVEIASTAIDLVSNITDLVVGLLPAGTISGRVVTDDGTTLRSLIQVAAVLVEDGKEIDEYRRDRTDVNDEGKFVLKGLFGQRVIRLAGFTDGWRIARVTVGKDDVTTVSIAAGTTVDDVVVVITRSPP
jgi:hypothetical protein